jgi:molybdopterin converting factor small subunit
MKEGDMQSQSQSSAITPNGSAAVRSMGGLGRTAKKEKIDKIFVSVPIKLDSLIVLLQKEYGIELRRDSTLIMINGVEARALGDLETVISHGDEVILVPMFHGG